MQIEVRKADMGKEKKRLKVCAYARVSTEASEQENSLENHWKIKCLIIQR